MQVDSPEQIRNLAVTVDDATAVGGACVAARVATGVVVETDERRGRHVETCLLAGLAFGGRPRSLGRFDQTTGEDPPPRERRVVAFEQQHLAVADDHGVGRERADVVDVHGRGSGAGGESDVGAAVARAGTVAGRRR